MRLVAKQDCPLCPEFQYRRDQLIGVVLATIVAAGIILAPNRFSEFPIVGIGQKRLH